MGKRPQGPWAGTVLGPYTGSSVSTREARSLHGMLSSHTGSLVPTREAPSLHGILGPHMGFLVPTQDPWFLHRKLDPYMGSLVPTREALSLHGMLSPYMGSLVPTWEVPSLHGILGPHMGSLVPTRILGPCTGSSVPTREALSPHGMLGPRTGCSVSTRDARSPHGMLGPYTGSSVPTRDARSLHGTCLVNAVISAGTHAFHGVSALEEPHVVSGVHSDTPGGFKQQDLPSRPGLESRGCGAVHSRSCQGRPVCLRPCPLVTADSHVWPCLTSRSCLIRDWTQGPSGSSTSFTPSAEMLLPGEVPPAGPRIKRGRVFGGQCLSHNTARWGDSQGALSEAVARMTPIT